MLPEQQLHIWPCWWHRGEWEQMWDPAALQPRQLQQRRAPVRTWWGPCGDTASRCWRCVLGSQPARATGGTGGSLCHRRGPHGANSVTRSERLLGLPSRLSLEC